MQLESNHLKYRDLKSEFDYEHNKLSIREIDIITREGFIANKEKELSIRESNLQNELTDFIKRKNDLSIWLAEYDDAVYLLDERKARLDEIESRIIQSKQRLIDDHNSTLNQFKIKEEYLLRKEHDLREKYRKISKEINYANPEMLMSKLNLDLDF